MWTAGAVRGFDHPVVMAATAKTTVIRACGTFETGLPDRCTVAGLDASGHVDWRHTINKPASFQLQESLTRDSILAEQSWILPSTAALLTRAGHDSGRPLLIDPESGRTKSLALERVHDLSVIGDRVLISQSGAKLCRWSVYRGTKRQWTRQNRGLCMRSFADDDYGNVSWIRRLYPDRAYLLTYDHPNRMTTLNLATGTSRPLGRSEATVDDGIDHEFGSGHDDQLAGLAGATTILSARGGTLIATDPDTGCRMWQRPTKITDTDDIQLSTGLLTAEPADVPNPYFGPIPHPDDDLDDLHWTTQRRLSLLNPATGRTRASVIGSDSDFWPNYPHHDLRDPRHAVVTSSDGGVLRLGG